MKKRRSSLLAISVVCIAGLLVGPRVLNWPGAPWNRAAALPLACWRPLQAPIFLAWSSDGKTLVSNYVRQTPELWSADGTPLPRALPVANSGVTCLQGCALSPAGLWFARDADSGVLPGVAVPPRARPTFIHDLPTAGRRIELVDNRTGRVARRLFWPPDTLRRVVLPDEATTFSADGHYAYACAKVGTPHQARGWSRIIGVWDTRIGRLLWTRRFDGFLVEGSEVHPVVTSEGRLLMPSVEVTPRGGVPTPSVEVLPGGAARTLPAETVIQLRDARSLEPIVRLATAPSDKLAYRTPLVAALSRREDLLASSLYSGQFQSKHHVVYLWNAKSGKQFWRWDAGDLYIFRIAFSPDDHWLAVAGIRNRFECARAGRPLNQLLIFDARSGHLMQALDDSTPRQRLALKLALRAQVAMERLPGMARSARGFDIPDLTPFSMAWSPDSRQLAVGYQNGEVRVWPVTAR